MSQLLDDRLRGLEVLAKAAFTGLAEKLTSRTIGLHSNEPGKTWLDISILAGDSNGNPGFGGEDLTIETRITVTVSEPNSQLGQETMRWLADLARVRLYAEPTIKSQLLANTVSTRWEDVVSELTGMPVFSLLVTIRSELPAQQMDLSTATGLFLEFDIDPTTAENAGVGHAIGSTAAQVIAWTTTVNQLGPIAVDILYAGAIVSDSILVKDASGTIVATLTLSTTPTGTVSSGVLPKGTYTAELGGATTPIPLAITERPTA